MRSSKDDASFYILCFLLNRYSRGIVRELLFIKMRTYAKNDEELWLCQWRNPLSNEITISEHTQFLSTLHKPVAGPK